jgi:hypothetical protein
LALDNLKSAEVVLADAQVLRADADQNADLFWAIRGGGGNFGVAASLEYALHPVGPIITGGLVAHPIEQAAELFKRFRDRCESAPDELMLMAGLLAPPDGSGAKLAGIVAAHCGSLAEGESAVRSIKNFGSPVLDAMGPIPYCDQNTLLDASFPRGALNHWKAHFLSELSDEAIKTLIECYEANPSPLSQIVIEHFHGEASRVPVEDTACAMRLSGYNVAIVSQWNDPASNEVCTSWCRDTYAALQPFLGSMRYVNYLGTDEGDDPAAVAYGPNYARLREIKQKYDPENVFHMNVNIKPAGS